MDLGDVPRDFLVAEICTVGLLRVLVPLAGEDALSTDGFKAHAHPADTGKQVDEREIRIRQQNPSKANRCSARHSDGAFGRKNPL